MDRKDSPFIFFLHGHNIREEVFFRHQNYLNKSKNAPERGDCFFLTHPVYTYVYMYTWGGTESNHYDLSISKSVHAGQTNRRTLGLFSIDFRGLKGGFKVFQGFLKVFKDFSRFFMVFNGFSGLSMSLKFFEDFQGFSRGLQGFSSGVKIYLKT